MNILVDRHHAGLLQSLHMLLEERLGMRMYVPIGIEWWNEGYWRFGEVFGDDRLAQQYLVPEGHGWEGSEVVGIMRNYDVEFPTTPIFGITLEHARAKSWAYVMPSVQENQPGYHRFAQEVGARYCYQVGNAGQRVDWGLDPLAIVSAEASIPEGAKGVRYHQEFDKHGMFFCRPALGDRHRIASFVNCFDRMPEQWSRFLEIEKLLPEFQLDVHGHDGRSGLVQPTQAVAERMAACGFGWHDKPQGDGFGHVLHYWAAVGRPLIGTRRYYGGKLAEHLWEDGVTAICLDDKGPDRVAAEIRAIASDEDRWIGMCAAIRERLDAAVDFDAEELQIRSLLGLA